MELFTPGHLVVLAVIALVLFFGWKQLPDMTRSLGRSLRIFNTEIKGMGQDDNAREADRAEREAQEPPKAIDPPPAQVVKNPVSGSTASSTPTAAPRPRPRPSNR